MKVLLAGAAGQVGLELSKLLPEKGHSVVALTREDLDITDRTAVRQAIESSSPDLVINAAAYTDVDGCETKKELAHEVNALGPRNLAIACEEFGCAILHVSTNYVFDGKMDRPYETQDEPNPISVYGRTKLAGEEYVGSLSTRWYVVRTAGVYGEGKNFVRTMLRVGRERNEVRVKDDEIVSPTYARDLAAGILTLAEKKPYGLYHLVNAGSCSWYEFAAEIFRLSSLGTEVVPVESSEYPLPAPRPANGVLSGTGSPRLRHWREALAEYLEREGVLSPPD